jgi:hypothetical protein
MQKKYTFVIIEFYQIKHTYTVLQKKGMNVNLFKQIVNRKIDNNAKKNQHYAMNLWNLKTHTKCCRKTDMILDVSWQFVDVYWVMFPSFCR